MKRIKTTGWYLDILLPAVYAKYLKNPTILDSKEMLQAGIQDPQIIAFLDCYPGEMNTLRCWAPKFKKLKTQANELQLLRKELERMDCITEAETISGICANLDRRISLSILAGITDISYDRNPVAPNPHNKTLTEGPGLAPHRGSETRRRNYNRINTTCPECNMLYKKSSGICPFCGVNPRMSLQPPSE